MARSDLMNPDFIAGPVQRAAPDFGALHNAGEQYVNDTTAVGDRYFAARDEALAPKHDPNDEDTFDYDLAVDPSTGDIVASDGTKPFRLKGTPKNVMLVKKAIEAGQLKPLGKIPSGWGGATFDEYMENLAGLDREWTTGKNAMEGLADSAGTVSKAVDLMVGTDKPDSVFSDWAQKSRDSGTLGQMLATDDDFWQHPESLAANLGTMGGQIAGTAAGGAAGALIGSLAGPAGTVAGGYAGGALTGGVSTAGDAGPAAYEATYDALKAMPIDELLKMPEYRSIRKQNPGDSHEKAIERMATEAAKAAMLPAAALGAGEALIGGKILGAVARRTPIPKLLGYKGAEAVGKSTGKTPKLPIRALQAVGRGTVAGLGESAIETAETVVPAVAAAHQSGVGSTDPRDYLSWEETKAVFPGSFLLGMGAGGKHGGKAAEDEDPVAAIRDSDLGDALLQIGHEKGSPLLRRLSGPGGPGGPEVTEVHPYEPNAPAPYQPEDIIEGEFTDTTPLQRLPGAGQGLLSDVPHSDPVRDRRDEIAAKAAEIQQREAPFQPSIFGDRQEPLQPSGAQGMGWNIPVQTEQYAPEEPDYGPAPTQEQIPGTPRPSLAERRTAQRAQSEESPMATAPGGQQLALPSPVGTDIEAQIAELEDQRTAIVDSEQQAAEYAKTARRGSTEWRKARAMLRSTREDIAALDEQIDALSEQWAQAREEAGPSGVRPQFAVEQSPAPNPPPGATDEAAPDGTGRPMGVAPAPLPNGAPQAPQEVASREQTQADRAARREGEPRGDRSAAREMWAGDTGKPLAQVENDRSARREGEPRGNRDAARGMWAGTNEPPVGTGAPTRSRTPSSPAAPPTVTTPPKAPRAPKAAAPAVTPSTPEPIVDLKAQIAALADPKAGKKAVLVAPENVPQIPKRLPKGVKRYPGAHGVLLTADEVLGQKYRAGKLSNKAMGKATEDAVADSAVAAAAPDATVVQAVTPEGAVAAEQVTTKGAKGEAAKRTSKQAGKGTKVVEVTPIAMQQRRAEVSEAEQARRDKLAQDIAAAQATADRLKAEKKAKPAKAAAAVETSQKRGRGRPKKDPRKQTSNNVTALAKLLALDWTLADIQKMSPETAFRLIDGNVAKKEGNTDLGVKGEAAVDTSKKDNESDAPTAREGGKQGAQSRDTDRVRKQSEEAAERARRANLKPKETPFEVEMARDRAERMAMEQARKAAAAVDDKAEPAPAATGDTLTTMASGVPAMEVAGSKGKTVDLRVVEVNEAEERKLERRAANPSVPAKERKDAEKQLGLIKQFRAAMAAAADAAVERMKAAFSVADLAKLEHAFHVEMEKHEEETKGKPGRPRETPRKSPLLYMPMTVAEVRGYLHAARAEAKASVRAYVPATSVYRRMISAVYPGAWAEMATHQGAQRWIKMLGDMDDVQLEVLMPVFHTTLMHSPFAKQVMRGANEVAYAIEEARASLNELEGLDAAVTEIPQMSVHKGIPEQASKLLAGWITHFERAGNKFSMPIRLMSLEEAAKRYPDAHFDGMLAAHAVIRGKKGQPAHHVIAIDPAKFGHVEAAVAEAMAHEFGHVVTEELYQRADDRTRTVLTKAYRAFLKRTAGHFANDIMFAEMTPYLRTTGQFASLDGDGWLYVRKFHEWSARNVALYLMDPNRSTHTVMEKFWGKVATILRTVWARVTGHPKPDAAWAESIDRWINGSLVIEPTMPASRVAFPGAPASLKDLAKLAKSKKVGVDDVVNQPDLQAHETEVNALRGNESGNPSFDDEAAYPFDTSSQKLGRKFTTAATDTLSGIRRLFEPSTEARPGSEGKIASKLKDFGLSFMSMRDMVRMLDSAGSVAKDSLKGWMVEMNKKSQLAKKRQEAAARWVRKAGQLTKKQQFYLEQIMAKATTYKIHPDMKWEDEGNKHLREGDPRVVALNYKRYKDLRKTWDALVGAEKDVEAIYKGLRDEIRSLHDDAFKLRKERITESDWLTDEGKVKALEINEELYQRDMNGPYFPKKRFGDYIATVKLPQQRIGVGGKVNGDFFETEKDARREKNRMKASHPDADLSIKQTEDGFALYMGINATAFYESQAEANSAEAQAELLAEVKERYSDVQGGYEAAVAEMKGKPIISVANRKRGDYGDSKAMGSAFGAELEQLLKGDNVPAQLVEDLRFLQYQSLPENNYTKQLLPRRDIIGASKNMLQAYVVGMQASANNFARLTHGKAIDKHWEAAWKATKEVGDVSAQRVMNELKKNQETVAKRERESTGENLLSTVGQLNSLYSLGFSVPYALSNMTQPWTVAVPVLAAFANGRTGNVIGMVKATKYMKDAYTDAFGFFGKRAVQETVAEWRNLANKPGSDFTEGDFQKQMLDRFAKDDPDFRAVMQHLYDSGLLDYTFISAMSDAAKTGGQTLSKIQRLSMAFPAQIEAMNRLVTAKAAVNLARDEHLVEETTNPGELSLFAEDIVAQTQGDYSRANRARVFNTAGVGLALQFKQYMQMMYMLFGHNLVQALRPGASKVERQQALRTMRNVMMTHGAIAGVSGLGPVSMVAKMTLAMAVMALGDDDDDRWKSPEQLQSDVLKDIFGDGIGEGLDQGLPRLLNADVGDRLAFPDLVDSRFLGISPTDKPSQGMDKVAISSLGAAYANSKRVVDGVSALAAGRGWDASKALPSGLRPILQSARMAKEGMTDGDGDVVIPASDLDWGDMAVKAIGGQPAAIARKYEDQREVKGTKARIAAKRQEVMQDARNGDIEWEDVAAYNKTVRPVFRISQAQLAKAIRAKADREKGDEAKGDRAVRQMLGR